MPVKMAMRCAVGLLVLLLLFYGTSLRHNLIFALLPLLFWLIWHFLPTRYRKTAYIIPCGLLLWGALLGMNNYVTYHMLHTYRLYPLQERFYGDIFILNYFAPHNYQNPPNTFGNNVDEVTPALFACKYDAHYLFQDKAFARIKDVTQQKNLYAKEFVYVSPKNRYCTENQYADLTIKDLQYEGYVPPLLKITENDVNIQYPKDYIILRNAWIKRIQKDTLTYLLHKTRIWLRSMNANFINRYSLLSVPVGGLLPCVIMALICLQTFSSRRCQTNILPHLMLAWSALFTALPLIIFLPDYDIRYLYWFYTASFIAIVHFCSQSKLFHEIVQTIHRYLEEKAAVKSGVGVSPPVENALI
jgi:hypothetical protein